MCDGTEKMMNAFWWGYGAGNEKKIHWMSWDRLCASKKNEGMGFKRLHLFNIALLAKQGWRISIGPASLMARVLKARYFPHTSFLDAKIGGRANYGWSSIMAGHKLIKDRIWFRVEKGENVFVYNDSWLPTSSPYTRN